MHNKAVFLDRDGVINKERGDYTYLLEDFIINKNVSEGLKILKNAGFLLIVISNQGGIAKQRYTMQQVEILHNYMFNCLQKKGVRLDEIYYCPHHQSTGRCICRKPDSQMIEKAMARFNISAEKSFLIGDSKRDIQAAQKVGVSAIKIKSNENILPYCKAIAEKTS